MARRLGTVLRTLGQTASASSAPSAPTLSVVNDGTGTSVTATVTGDSGVTHRLFYRLKAASAWTVGLARTGNGTIVQTGLAAGGVYLFIAVSDNGPYSLPSPVVIVACLSGSDTPESSSLALAQAVTDALNTDTFCLPFTAERTYLPEIPLKQATPGKVYVWVAPRLFSSEMKSRSEDENSATINVWVVSKLSGHDLNLTELDTLMLLVGQIEDSLNRQRMAGWAWISTRNAPIYASDHLHQYHEFLSLLTLTYKMVRLPGGGV